MKLSTALTGKLRMTSTKETKQTQIWEGEFGKKYTERNPSDLQAMEEMYQQKYGCSRLKLNESFLSFLPKNIKILEVGCNVGHQLNYLQQFGFTNLYGIELQQDAVEKAKQNTKGINIMQGSGFDLPFRDRYFDLVFTSTVLIHIAPKDIAEFMAEVFRVSKKYIWGLEYFNETHVEVPYRGYSELLWKADFAKLYQKQFPSLQLVQEKKLAYLEDPSLVDAMYLLEKN